MNFLFKKILFPFLILTIVAIIYNTHDVKKTTNLQEQYMLKSYKNTVALYNGEEIIDVYTNIVLNTLPEKDVQSFNRGISFDTRELAEAYLQDFD